MESTNQESRDAALADVVAETVERHTAAVVTDAASYPHLVEHHKGGVLLLEADQGGNVSNDTLLHMARAGKPIFTWCSATEEGRRTARNVAKTYKRHLQAGRDVLHIPTPAPIEWNPAVTSWKMIRDGAVTSLPALPPKAGGAPAGRVDHTDFLTSDGAVARRIVLNHADRLLVVNPDATYVLSPDGVWSNEPKPWHGYLWADYERLLAEVTPIALTDPAGYASVVKAIANLTNKGRIEGVRAALAAHRDMLAADGYAAADDVVICDPPDMNNDPRYMGCASGVIDLATGTLLTPDVARTKLVTLRANAVYDSSATHPDVDNLTAHLPTDLQEWWWDALGYHLRFGPERRFYAIIGEAGGGKSTLLDLLAATLGDYFTTASESALDRRRQAGAAALSPEMSCFTGGARFCAISDARIGALDTDLLKKISGGDLLTWRGMRENTRTTRATATVLLVCNPESVPRMRLEEPAVRARFRQLPYPAVPTTDVDDDYRRRVRSGDPKMLAAMLAKLVKHAARQTGKPPDEPADVVLATAARVELDAGAIGQFAKRLVRAPGENLSIAGAWREWCEFNGDDADSGGKLPTESGGIFKRSFTDRLAGHCPGLKTDRVYVDGKQTKGYRGWKLVDEPPDTDEAPAIDVAQEAPAAAPVAPTKRGTCATEGCPNDAVSPSRYCAPCKFQ